MSGIDKASSNPGDDWFRGEARGRTVVYGNPGSIDIVCESDAVAEKVLADDVRHGGLGGHIVRRDGRRPYVSFPRQR